jgi:hypothetical protein
MSGRAWLTASPGFEIDVKWLTGFSSYALLVTTLVASLFFAVFN